jgi:hypothetical protein
MSFLGAMSPPMPKLLGRFSYRGLVGAAGAAAFLIAAGAGATFFLGACKSKKNKLKLAHGEASDKSETFNGPKTS